MNAECNRTPCTTDFVTERALRGQNKRASPCANGDDNLDELTMYMPKIQCLTGKFGVCKDDTHDLSAELALCENDDANTLRDALHALEDLSATSTVVDESLENTTDTDSSDDEVHSELPLRMYTRTVQSDGIMWGDGAPRKALISTPIPPLVQTTLHNLPTPNTLNFTCPFTYIFSTSDAPLLKRHHRLPLANAEFVAAVKCIEFDMDLQQLRTVSSRHDIVLDVAHLKCAHFDRAYSVHSVTFAITRYAHHIVTLRFATATSFERALRLVEYFLSTRVEKDTYQLVRDDLYEWIAGDAWSCEYAKWLCSAADIEQFALDAIFSNKGALLSSLVFLQQVHVLPRIVPAEIDETSENRDANVRIPVDLQLLCSI